MMADQWLFSYGTLRQPEVQRKVFGRALHAADDALSGYRIEQLRITDAEVIALSGSDNHPVLRRGNADEQVSGSALAVTEEDLVSADAYEVADYVRIRVILASGRQGHVYVHRDDERTPVPPAPV